MLSPPSDFLAVYLFGKFRMDTVLRVASVVSFLGAMFRFFAIQSEVFWPILVGTILMATVSSIFLNAQIIIANNDIGETDCAAIH